MTETRIQEVAELISNGLAPAVIILSLCVVIFWLDPAKKSFKTSIKTSEHWFIIGVFLGFLGESFDNLYWTFAWTLKYLEVSSTGFWMSSGVFANIPFRQILGIVAAYCHIRSAIQYKNEHKFCTTLNYLLIFSILLGILFSFSLVIAKPFVGNL